MGYIQANLGEKHPQYVFDETLEEIPTIRKRPGFPIKAFSYLSARMLDLGPATLVDRPLDGVSVTIQRWGRDLISSLAKDDGTNRKSRRQADRDYGGFVVSKMVCTGDSVDMVAWQNGSGRSICDVFSVDTPPFNAALTYASHNYAVLCQRLAWTATFFAPSAIGFTYPTDPTGLRVLLEDRERMHGRKPALLHWVREHARRNRSSDDLAFIRRYLRGARECLWRGYRVEIREPEVEREYMANRGPAC